MRSPTPWIGDMPAHPASAPVLTRPAWSWGLAAGAPRVPRRSGVLRAARAVARLAAARGGARGRAPRCERRDAAPATGAEAARELGRGAGRRHPSPQPAARPLAHRGRDADRELDPARGEARRLRDRAIRRSCSGGAVVVPYVISRWVFRDRAIGFPWRGGGRWTAFQWSWLVGVLFLGWLILPFYFITTGVYLNWPVVDTPDMIARLFVGVGASASGTSCSSSAPCSRCCAGTSGSGRRTCCRRSCSSRSCGSSAIRRGGRCSPFRSRCCRASSS